MMEKTKFFKFFCLVLAAVFVVNSYTIDFGVFAAEKDGVDYSDIVYISGNKADKMIKTRLNEEKDEDIRGIKVRVVKPGKIGKLKVKPSDDIWVDGGLMGDETVREAVRGFYDKGCRIVFRKNDIMEKEVVDYLGLKSEDALEDSLENFNSELKRVALRINKEVGGSYTIEFINVEQYHVEEEVEKALMYSSKSIDRLRIKNKTASLFNRNFASAATLEWMPVNSRASLDTWESVTVRYSLSLQKHSNNPDSAGQYYTLHKHTVEITPRSSAYFVYNAWLYQSGSSDSVVYAYSPQDTDSNGDSSITLSIPAGFSYSFSPGTAIKVHRDAGGIGSRFVQVNFYPCDLFGKRLYAYGKRIRFELNSEMYQKSKPFKSGMYYKIVMGKLAAPTLTATATHYISGY